ncbi:hypothetical protein V8E36_000159 [Tilletia maclaganii]
MANNRLRNSIGLGNSFVTERRESIGARLAAVSQSLTSSKTEDAEKHQSDDGAASKDSSVDCESPTTLSPLQSRRTSGSDESDGGTVVDIDELDGGGSSTSSTAHSDSEVSRWKHQLHLSAEHYTHLAAYWPVDDDDDASATAPDGAEQSTPRATWPCPADDPTVKPLSPTVKQDGYPFPATELDSKSEPCWTCGSTETLIKRQAILNSAPAILGSAKLTTPVSIGVCPMMRGSILRKAQASKNVSRHELANGSTTGQILNVKQSRC